MPRDRAPGSPERFTFWFLTLPFLKKLYLKISHTGGPWVSLGDPSTRQVQNTEDLSVEIFLDSSFSKLVFILLPSMD